jgi:hypothetical protein
VTIADVVSEVEAAGVTFRLDGEKIRVWYPDDDCREELAGRIALLRNQRAEVAAYLKIRSAIPQMPEGVRLVRWEPMPAPIALTSVEIITDVLKFVTITLLELKAALIGKKWLAGNRSVRELIERLEECGVVVEVESGRP